MRLSMKRIAVIALIVVLVNCTLSGLLIPRIAYAAVKKNTVLLAGSDWLKGAGVDVYSNDGDANSEDGDFSYVNIGTEANPINIRSGYRWQCVELINRLYLRQGWISTTWLGNGYEMYDKAPGLAKEADGSIASISPGDVIVFGGGTFFIEGHAAGHVLIVDSVDGTTIHVVSQNVANPRSTLTWDKEQKKIKPWSGYTTTGIVHAPGTVSKTASVPNGPTSSYFVPGNWSGDARQDFVYITKRTGANDGGFDVAVQEQTSSGIVWRGTWWSQSGSNGMRFEKTVFIPADADGDGLLDLYYATSADWNALGFDVALVRNTGSSFVYAGQRWNPTNLKLAETKFLPGKWVSGYNAAFAYVTKGRNSGFDIAVFGSTPSSLVWLGSRMNKDGSSGVQFGNTVFLPSDMDADGLTDLYFATAVDWSRDGFSVGLMHNSSGSLDWAGTAWAPSGIKLGQTGFITLANFSGDSRQDIAYVTRRASSGGFDVSVMESTPSGLTWRGTWWTTDSLQFDKIRFIPSDMDSDGLVDLFYATPGSNRIDCALTRNTGRTFSYWGQQWNPIGLDLSWTAFL